MQWSGWPDLNRRPPHPQRGALPGCATSRANYYIGLYFRYEYNSLRNLWPFYDKKTIY